MYPLVFLLRCIGTGEMQDVDNEAEDAYFVRNRSRMSKATQQIASYDTPCVWKRRAR